jgi:hypothetical protein
MSFKGMIRDNAPPMVFPPYRGGGVWVLLRPWSYAGSSVATGKVTHAGQVKG